MHMADALISPSVGVGFWALSVGGIAYSAKKLKEQMDDKIVPLMGILGAFVFAAQMINFTIPATGSSGHLGGGMLLSILLGPYAGFIVMASILTIQALFFADGGLLALGCNIWNLGFYTSFIAYPLIYKQITKNGKYHFIASLISVVVGLQLGAFSVVLQTFFSGISELPFKTFVMLMQPIHLAIGIVEGIVTAAIIKYVYTIKPEILLTSIPIEKKMKNDTSIKKLILMFAVLTVITGGLLSWFASSNPDGLEWSIEKVYGKPELPEKDSGIVNVLKNIQEKLAILPDYTFKKLEKKEEASEIEKYPNIDIGTSVSGILGALVVLLVAFGTGYIIKTVKRRG
ncbi:MAG: energy-coupling factor ABC transporter permease [Proteobacteria bacterium]|nr:energy-coupling factor ABC transporter permease [Pseudomonadota bacterium]